MNEIFSSFLFREMETSEVVVLEMMMQITLMLDMCDASESKKVVYRIGRAF